MVRESFRRLSRRLIRIAGSSARQIRSLGNTEEIQQHSQQPQHHYREGIGLRALMFWMVIHITDSH